MRLLVVILSVFGSLCGCSTQPTSPSWALSSPGENFTIWIELTGPVGKPDGKNGLRYRITSGTELNGKTILEWSPLGISLENQSFVQDLLPVRTSFSELDEPYTLVHGKRTSIRNRANQLVLTFTNQDGHTMEGIFRAHDDGVAFRYFFPKSMGTEKGTVLEELTGFHLPEDSLGYLQPYDEASRYTPAYEAYFQMNVPVGTPSPGDAGWSFPALFKTPSGFWVLLTEADLDGSYCSTRLAKDSFEGTYRVRLPDAEEGKGVGEVNPTSAFPFASPWRVLIIGNSLAPIVESTLVTDLSPPSKLGSTDWVIPGRVAWSWWSDPDSPKHYDRIVPFIDLASDMGWEYFLVDANWDEMGEDAIPRLVEYSARKGVGILLWYNSGGPHNDVTEKPRDRMFVREIRRKEMAWMRDLGVKGIKVDFFQSDKQDRIQQYIDILEDAAEFRILVNFHGCTLPSGWSRTYPHLMTMEAVRATESYIYDSSYPSKAPWHNSVLVFTRGVVGPMDYTPVALSDNRYPHLTSAAHELALPVVFESGLLHFADNVSTYSALPDEPKAFLRQIPTAWHDTRFLSGEPGDSAVIARRNGKEWYIGAISGIGQERSMRIEFSFLGEGEYKATIISDGDSRDRLNWKDLTLTSTSIETVRVNPNGGFVIRIMPAS